jgi:hypothetical protein
MIRSEHSLWFDIVIEGIAIAIAVTAFIIFYIPGSIAAWLYDKRKYRE